MRLFDKLGRDEDNGMFIVPVTLLLVPAVDCCGCVDALVRFEDDDADCDCCCDGFVEVVAAAAAATLAK